MSWIFYGEDYELRGVETVTTVFAYEAPTPPDPDTIGAVARQRMPLHFGGIFYSEDMVLVQDIPVPFDPPSSPGTPGISSIEVYYRTLLTGRTVTG